MLCSEEGEEVLTRREQVAYLFSVSANDKRGYRLVWPSVCGKIGSKLEPN